MSISVHRTTGEASLSRSRQYWHGPEKIGKSMTASGFPRCAFVTTEARHDHLPGANVLLLRKGDHQPTVKKWEDFLQVVEELGRPACQREIETVVIDTVDLSYELAQDYVLKKHKWEYESDGGYGKGWKLVDREWKAPIYDLLTMPYGLIFISHTKIEEIRSLEGSRHKFVSTFADRGRRILVPHMGVVAWIGWGDEVRVDGDGKRVRTRRRMMHFESPDDLIECGDGEGRLPERIPLFEDPRETYDLMNEYYNERRRR